MAEKLINKDAYDDLCDQVRHVATNVKFFENVKEQEEIVREELVARVGRLEKLIAELGCEVIEDEQ